MLQTLFARIHRWLPLRPLASRPIPGPSQQATNGWHVLSFGLVEPTADNLQALAAELFQLYPALALQLYIGVQPVPKEQLEQWLSANEGALNPALTALHDTRTAWLQFKARPRQRQDHLTLWLPSSAGDRRALEETVRALAERQAVVLSPGIAAPPTLPPGATWSLEAPANRALVKAWQSLGRSSAALQLGYSLWLLPAPAKTPTAEALCAQAQLCLSIEAAAPLGQKCQTLLRQHGIRFKAEAPISRPPAQRQLRRWPTCPRGAWGELWPAPAPRPGAPYPGIGLPLLTTDNRLRRFDCTARAGACVVLGGPGAGQSSLLQDLVAHHVARGGPAVVLDREGEFVRMATALGLQASLISSVRPQGLDPLAAAPAPELRPYLPLLVGWVMLLCRTADAADCQILTDVLRETLATETRISLHLLQQRLTAAASARAGALAQQLDPFSTWSPTLLPLTGAPPAPAPLQIVDGRLIPPDRALLLSSAALLRHLLVRRTATPTLLVLSEDPVFHLAPTWARQVVDALHDQGRHLVIGAGGDLPAALQAGADGENPKVAHWLLMRNNPLRAERVAHHSQMPTDAATCARTLHARPGGESEILCWTPATGQWGVLRHLLDPVSRGLLTNAGAKPRP